MVERLDMVPYLYHRDARWNKEDTFPWVVWAGGLVPLVAICHAPIEKCLCIHTRPQNTFAARLRIPETPRSVSIPGGFSFGVHTGYEAMLRFRKGYGEEMVARCPI